MEMEREHNCQVSQEVLEQNNEPQTAPFFKVTWGMNVMWCVRNRNLKLPKEVQKIYPSAWQDVGDAPHPCSPACWKAKVAGSDRWEKRRRKMYGNKVVGRQKKKKRAEATFKGEKEPGNNFRCLPGEYNVTISTDTTFAPASPPPPSPPFCHILYTPHPLYYLPSSIPSVLLHEGRWCQIQYFTARSGRWHGQFGLWVLSSLGHGVTITRSTAGPTCQGWRGDGECVWDPGV